MIWTEEMALGRWSFMTQFVGFGRPESTAAPPHPLSIITLKMNTAAAGLTPHN
jgi:hypothetical protein